MAEEIPTNSWKLLYETGRQALQDRKLQEAEQSFSAALQLAEDFAAGDPRLAATLNALARIYSLQRRYLAAAALLNRLLEVTERTLGPTHVQVAGVLTNLAEMYTHLGAAREELELRERVLSIRGDDPNADATTLQRLRDRVAELRSMLAAQEATADLDDEIEREPLPTVRTAEYSAPIPTVREREAEPVREPIAAREPVMSPALTAAGEADEMYSYDGEPKSTIVASSGVEIISIERPPAKPIATTDHGFSDMGRDELPAVATRKSLRTRPRSSPAARPAWARPRLAACRRPAPPSSSSTATPGRARRSHRILAAASSRPTSPTSTTSARQSRPPLRWRHCGRASTARGSAGQSARSTATAARTRWTRSAPSSRST